MKSTHINYFTSFFYTILFFMSGQTAYGEALSTDYSAFEKVLENWVVSSDQGSRVKYESLKKNSVDLYKFNRSVSAIGLADFKKLKEKEQIALLVNAYNSFTLQLIIENYPIASIKEIGGLFGNPWKKKFFQFLGESSSLDRIEHELLRKNYKEPRIHFAINCASISCPPLQRKIYDAENIDEQMMDATKYFLNNKNFNLYDVNTNTLMLSSIFKWYGTDFGNEKELRGFLAEHMGAKGKDRDAILKTAKIIFLKYDWGLNDVRLK